MRILLSTENFDAFGGTETYTKTIARELDRLGHQTAIYTPRPGTMAALAIQQGLDVIGPKDLPDSCDALLAQDAATSQELSLRYPDAVRLFVAHSRDHVLQEPPQLPEVCDGVLVLNDRVGRWVKGRSWHAPLTRLRQPIELSRFRDLAEPRNPPRRVLATTNYVGGARGLLLDEACTKAGYEVQWIGTTSKPNPAPEQAIAGADIVIGLGRSALEGMASGRAVYVYGALGAGGWVTPEAYPTLEADGFAGLNDGAPATVSSVAAELERWQPDMGEANRDLATANHGVRTHAIELIELIRELASGRTTQEPASIPPGPAGPPSAALELARLLRLEWQMFDRAMRRSLDATQMRTERERYRAEAEDAVARVEVLDEELKRAHERVAELEALLAEDAASLSAFRATRRFRTAQLLGSPLDHIRKAKQGPSA